MENPSPMTPKKIFSLGYRCSSAGILKEMRLKQESFPFDWLISRLSVIKQCIQDDFQEFMKIENYENRHTNTYEMAENQNHFICDEYLVINRHYQPPELLNAVNSYQYYLAMNHYLITDTDHRDYYVRCIERFRKALDQPCPKLFVHICPLISEEKYEKTRYSIVNEITYFDRFLYERTEHTSRGLYFIMVKKQGLEHPKTTEFVEMFDSGSKYFLIYTNQNFLDAGEIFMGNSHYEKEFIKKQIQKEID
jgi:hypothetical protein